MPLTLWCNGLSGSGDWVPDPPVEAVVAYLRADYSEWGWADPMVELGWYEWRGVSVPPVAGMSGDELVRQLLAIRNPDRGFYFEYRERPDGRWLAAIDPAGSRDECVPNISHGEEAYFLAAYFLPLAASERVVADFMTTQEPSPALEWMPFQPLWPRRSERPRRK
jgi:hypothetical protein